MPKAIRTSVRKGDIITDTYTKTKTRPNLIGGKTTKVINTKTVTDLANQKTMATGTKSKTKTNSQGVVMTKTKSLSPRKVLNRY